MPRFRSLLVALALLCAALGVLVPGAQARRAKVHRIGKLHILHHGDPIRGMRKRFRPAARTSALATSGWDCTETTADRPSYLSNAPQIKVVYAYPSDQADQLATVGDLIQGDAAALMDKVAAESGNSKSIRFDVGGTGGGAGVCTNDARNRLDIQTVALAHPASYYAVDDAFDLVLNEIGPQLTPADPNQRVNYVVYLDNVHPDLSYSGQADFGSATQHGYDNPVNQGRNGRGDLFGLVYGYGGADFEGDLPGNVGEGERRTTFLHELSHTLGAVQLNAPHSSGAAHCYDGADIMCYDDGGPYYQNGGSLLSLCSGDLFTSSLDCNKDDYFNSSPAAGSYLADNWNEYDSVFLCPVAECDSTLPAFSVTLSAGHDSNGRLVVNADPHGASIAHYEWDQNGGVFDTDTGSLPVYPPKFTTGGTLNIALRAVKPDGSFAYASLPVTPVAPVPSFSASGDHLIGGTATFDASATSDPDGLIDHVYWDLDGDGTFERDSGVNRVVTTTFTRAGVFRVGLEVDYGNAWSRTFANYSVAAGAPAPLPVTPAPIVAVKAPTVSALEIKLRRLLSSGLPMSVRCYAQCSVQFALSVDAKTARRLHLRGKRGKPVVVGRLRGQYVAGTVTPILKLSGAARRALAHSRSLKATLTGSVHQNAVSPLALTKALTFKR